MDSALALVRLGSGTNTVGRLLGSPSLTTREIESVVSELIAIAVDDLERDPWPAPAARAVLTIFRDAGKGRGGRSYLAAVDWHIELYRRATHGPFRAEILSSLGYLNLPPGRYIEFLEHAVFEADISAMSAVTFLDREGAPGLAVLRRIYRTRLDEVVNPQARSQIGALAKHHGW